MTISTKKFEQFWKNHPRNEYPCNSEEFANQCAVRMGIAIEKSGYDTSSFDTMFKKRRCWFKHEDGIKHILAAHELAQWLNANPSKFGVRSRLITPTQRSSIVAGTKGAKDKGKKGIIYINNGWGSTDHIDLWDGEDMSAGDTDWLNLGNEIWFWEAA